MNHTPHVDLGLARDCSTASLTGTECSEIFNQSCGAPVTRPRPQSAAQISCFACDNIYVIDRPGACWGRRDAWDSTAEADGNRTRRRREAPSTGFEDRGGHQAPGRLRGRRYPRLGGPRHTVTGARPAPVTKARSGGAYI